ncbi:MAG: SufD family Fe-S cluster assembly protein [bacterium]
MLIKEIYEKLPQPLKTQHTWRYSEYSYFVKDESPTTQITLSSNLNLVEKEIFEPITINYPEKITVYNYMYHTDKFATEIVKNGVYNLSILFSGKYNLTRGQIKIAPNLEIDLVLNLYDNTNQTTTNNVIEILVQDNSKVRILFDHSFHNSYAHNFVYLRMMDNSDVRMVFSSFNPKYEKTHIRSLIDGLNSNFVVYILAKVDATQHVDYRTENIHLKSSSKSLSVYRSIADGRSRSIYTGMLRIEKDAKYCNAYQNSRNILLSDKAKVETIPELEILNQEVACTHGAVVSSIDEEAIYYFMSRGVSREEAVKLITEGFLLDKLEENLQNNLYPIIYKKVTGEEYHE